MLIPQAMVPALKTLLRPHDDDDLPAFIADPDGGDRGGDVSGSHGHGVARDGDWRATRQDSGSASIESSARRRDSRTFLRVGASIEETLSDSSYPGSLSLSFSPGTRPEWSSITS